jgi:hypothetical protein
VLRARRQAKKNLRGGFARGAALAKLLFRWSDDKTLRANTFNDFMWRPTVVKAGVIPEPPPGVLPADSVSITGLAAYLGHADPGFTLRVYTRLLPGSRDRAVRAIVSRSRDEQDGEQGESSSGLMARGFRRSGDLGEEELDLALGGGG